MIIWYAWSSEKGNVFLWLAGVLGAFITGIYTFRMVFVTFFGEAKMKVDRKPGMRLHIPLLVLGFLSIIAGFIELPDTMGHLKLFSGFLHSILPPVRAAQEAAGTELLFQIITAVLALSGIFLAYIFYIRKFKTVQEITRGGFPAMLRKYWFSGWGFDWLYDHVFVFPIVWLSVINKNDFIDLFYNGIASVNRTFNRQLIRTQSGQLRWYAVGILIGAVITLTIVVFI
jgi:NADH-quinone oxidoreductase subunit L